MEANDKVTEASFVKTKPVYFVKLKEDKFLYGAEQPLLLKGKKYAWRVQVATVNERLEKEPFRNEGYSEINWFQLK